jgi:hypothetical protein
MKEYRAKAFAANPEKVREYQRIWSRKSRGEFHKCKCGALLKNGPRSEIRRRCDKCLEETKERTRAKDRARYSLIKKSGICKHCNSSIPPNGKSRRRVCSTCRKEQVKRLSRNRVQNLVDSYVRFLIKKNAEVTYKIHITNEDISDEMVEVYRDSLAASRVSDNRILNRTHRIKHHV